MIYQLYEWRLLHQLSRIPSSLCFMISEDEMCSSPDQLFQVISWCLDISSEIISRHPESAGLQGITIHISRKGEQETPGYLPDIRRVGSIARLYLHYGTITEKCGTGLPVAVAIGKSGREEIVDAIRRMADEGLAPEEITGEIIEQHLLFKHTPDFVIKTGGDHLVDFLIWQSVYSELFFSDLNWNAIRKVDLIRAFRDYLSRIRRFGT